MRDVSPEHEEGSPWPSEIEQGLAGLQFVLKAREGQEVVPASRLRRLRVRVLTLAGAVGQIALLIGLVAVALLVIGAVDLRDQDMSLSFVAGGCLAFASMSLGVVSWEIRKTIN